MTLLVATKRFGVPFLVSDVLRSRKIAAAKHAEIATSANVAAAARPGWEVGKPVQKAYIVSDSFCIAMAGDYEEGKAAVRQIAAHFDGKTPSPEAIFDYLTSAVDPGDRGFVLIGWIVYRGKQLAFQWKSKFRPINEPDFLVEEEFVVGSGASEYRKRTQETESEAGFRIMPYAVLSDPTLEARLDVLCDIGYLVNLQLVDGTGLDTLFGGGFHLIYLSGNRFQFIDRYTIAFAHGAIDRDLKWTAHVGEPLVTHQWTDGSMLIRRFNLARARSTLSKNRMLCRITKETATTAENVLSTDLAKATEGLDIVSDYYILPFILNWYDNTHMRETVVFTRQPQGAFTYRVRLQGRDVEMETGANWQPNLDRLVQGLIDRRHRLLKSRQG